MYISRNKKDIIRRHYINGELNVPNIAEKLQLRAGTVRFYFNEFRVLEKLRPDKLHDFDFFIDKEKIFQTTVWFRNFESIMPGLVLAEPGPLIVAEKMYRKYHEIYPDEYSKPRFYYVFKRWFVANVDKISSVKLREKFTAKELQILQKWRRGNDRRLWQVAVVLMSVYHYHSLGDLADRIETTYATMLRWIRAYRRGGLEAVNRPGNKKPVREERRLAIEKRRDDIVHMVRQSPKLYGIDKISWTLTDLAYAYSKFTGKAVSFSTVGNCLKIRGIKFKRSREVIVSNDPLFREKFDRLQDVLSGLGKKRKILFY